MRKGLAILVLGAVLTSACASGGAPRAASATPAPQPSTGFRPPVVQNERGLESVIGKGARDLTRRFGKARLDLTEGEARKLQFSSRECVLDVFLYPLRDNAAPVATHVEARQRIGGGDTDRARCIEEVERSR